MTYRPRCGYCGRLEIENDYCSFEYHSCPGREDMPESFTNDGAVEMLEATTETHEGHLEADFILLAVLRQNGLSAVADAFEAARERLGFWYS